MRTTPTVCRALALGHLIVSAVASPNLGPRNKHVVTPKVFLIDMFPPEGNVWYGIPEFNLLERNITVPGFSPLFPDAHCTEDGSVCQLITGESEINAAASITALTFSPLFDLRKTYFMVAGIAGINPKIATLGSVTFARYAVQVGLQYEFDAREIPSNFTTGYLMRLERGLPDALLYFLLTIVHP